MNEAKPLKVDVKENVCDRLTAMLVVHHENCQVEPTSIQSTFSAYLKTIAQPYVRQLKASLLWQPLDTGWLKESGYGYVVIENNASLPKGANPSDEQRDALTKWNLIIGSKGNDEMFIIRPGRFLVAEMIVAENILMRSESLHNLPYTLSLMPS